MLRKRIVARLCLTGSVTILLWGTLSSNGCAQDTTPTDSATLVEKIQIPVEVQGKKVGTTTVAAGTKVKVVAREGDRVSVKFGSLAPVWLKESQVSGLPSKSAEKTASSSSADSRTNLAKLKVLMSAKNWSEVAHTCEAFANETSGRFAALAEMGKQLKSFLQARAAASAELGKAEKEAQRLRRNAEVTGQPNPLNPNDNSPMERAQKYREQAIAVIEKAKTALEMSEAQVAKLGADISSEVSRLESEVLRNGGGDVEAATSVSNNSTVEDENPDTDAEIKMKVKAQAYMAALDWPVKTHTHEDALRDINESMEKNILPKLGLTFEECARKCPIDPKKTHEENLQLQKKLAIQLEEGWAKSSFRCGDIIAMVAFDESGTAADVRYSHMKDVLNCSDDSLLAAVCRYNEPSATWDELPEQSSMKFSVAFDNSPEKPVALMNAKASEIYLSTPRAQAFWNSKKAAQVSAPKALPDMDTGTSNGSQASADTHAATESDENQGAFRRGPKIHGFQVGMTLDEFRTALSEVCPEAKELDWGERGFRLKSSDPVYSPLLADNSTLNSFIYREGSDKGPILGSALVLGPSQIVVQLQLTFAVLNNVFETKGLDWKEFCQATIDAYNIPELVPSENSMVYRSDEGWGISLTPNRGLQLQVTPRTGPKVPVDPAARGFGG